MRRLGGGYQIKTNVFLAPDPREGAVLPVYTLVNENGVPYMVGSEVLQVGPQDVLAARQLASQKTIDQLREEARQERERYLRQEQSQGGGSAPRVIDDEFLINPRELLN